MTFTHPATTLQKKLEGQPNMMLTVLLLFIAAFIIIIALQPNPLLKAGVVAWCIFP